MVSFNEVVAELRAMRLSRDGEVEVMKKKDSTWINKGSKKRMKAFNLSLSSLLNAGLSISSFRDTTPFHSLNVNEYDEWEAQVVQQNRQLDVIMSELLIGIPNMSVRDHPRARRRYCDREREQGEACLMKDYFVDNPMYGEENFRGRQGLLPLQKCIGAMRVLAYRASVDTHDEYLRINKTVTRDALVKFVEGVISCFREEYLRRPNQDDLARLLHVGEEHGFPGMVRSIDCMHWEWKKCPTTWAGQYAGRSGKTIIIFEFVELYALWICHAFIGTPGSCNDIN
uniref:Uncharacterized protein n=1 Tax=Lactuca sativa TaxID=4236 RepID=A0A9R1X2C8_LACSA|nr:hypothetical protein LSAT_V11C800406810 [Lactuca sativa]